MHRNLHDRATTQAASPSRFTNGIRWGTLLFGFVLVLSACAVQGSPAEPDTTTADGSTTADGPISTTALGTTITTLPGTPGVIRHTTGFSLSYPEGWHETGIVISTEFAIEAQCVAALIVDQAPPTDPAQAGFVLQSGVQVCAMPLEGESLDTYMESVYGAAISDFTRSESDGVVEYRRNDGLASHTFVQTDSYRYQVTTFVTANPDLVEERLAQVQQILASLIFS